MTEEIRHLNHFKIEGDVVALGELTHDLSISKILLLKKGEDNVVTERGGKEDEEER